MARYLEDFKPGDRYETASIEITEEMIFQFAGQYDPQPFHLSRDAAQNSLERNRGRPTHLHIWQK